MPQTLFTLMLLVVAATPVSTHASPAQSPDELDEHAPVYVAMGDSLAFGSGSSDPARTGYVPLVHAALQDDIPCNAASDAPCDDLQLLNLAENGATTESLQETQLRAAIEILEGRNGDADPTNDVVAISITVGGNDAFSALIQVCAQSINVVCAERAQQIIGTIERNLTTSLEQLREAAGPDTRIAVMTYFNSLIACDFQSAAPNADLMLEGAPGLARGLNEVIRLAADRADAAVADTFGLLGASDLVGGVDCLHTNDAGYEKIADVFTDAFTSDIASNDP